MKDWRRLLKSDPTDWLLEEDNPSVRFFTLTELLGRRPQDAAVRAARAAIMIGGPVPRILARQKPAGNWGKPEDFYVYAKYKGTVWNLMLLASLGAVPGDERVRRACEFVLAYSQDRGSGGFSFHGDRRGGFHRCVIPCLTGNMVWSLIRLGYLGDARVKQGIDWIVRYQRFDDAVEHAPAGWPYDLSERCWGRHTCHNGAVKALKALAAIPPGRRSGAIRQKIEQGAEYLLRHHIYKRSHNLALVSKPDWLELGYPQMANDDTLEILRVLVGLGCRDPRMAAAIDLVLSKQGKDGRWRQESRLSHRYLTTIEQFGQPSKWVTLNALVAMKQYRETEKQPPGTPASKRRNQERRT